MSVHVKWQNSLVSEPFSSEKHSSREGGMTSPLEFNIFSQKYVGLSECESRMNNINIYKYNVFCYADDLLLTSTTPTGFQTLIDRASLAEKSARKDEKTLFWPPIIIPRLVTKSMAKINQGRNNK